MPQALAALERGGCVVRAGIHMSDLPSFPYRLMWGERQLRSVANFTRDDGLAFLALAERIPLRVATQRYALEGANEALDDLRRGAVACAAVLNVQQR